MRPSSLVPAVLSMLLVSACGDRDLGEQTRPLGEWQMGGQTVQLEGRWSGEHVAGHARREWIGWEWGFDRYTVAWRFAGARRLARGSHWPTHLFEEKADADAALAGLTVDGCVRDETLVYRVEDSSAEPWSAPWRVAYVLEQAIVDVDAPVQEGSCTDVLAATPSWAQWLHDQANGEAACALARDTGHLHDWVRCALRDKTGGVEWVTEGAIAPESQPAFTPADLEEPTIVDALFQEVGPDSDVNADGLEAASLVLKTRARDKQRAWIAAIADKCATRGCPAWQADAASLVARELADPQLCASMVHAAAQLLDRHEDAAALMAIAAVTSCGPEQEVAAVMRTGLRRRTGGDIVLDSPDQTAYDMVDNDCNDKTVIYADGSASSLCLRFPRLAGSWLSRHCDAQAVEAAKSAATYRTNDDPRLDMVFDGALRVLGKCNVEAFEAAIEGVPEQSGASVVDIRSKSKLRELFLQ